LSSRRTGAVAWNKKKPIGHLLIMDASPVSANPKFISEEECMAANLKPAPIDEEKLNAFLGKVVEDFGAAISSSLAYIGQRLGLYKAMAGAGGLTPAELAERTGTVERYVREWLINQAAGGYVEYDAASGRYSLPPEQAVALTDESSPFYVGGGFYLIKAVAQASARIAYAFEHGGGMLWREHDPDLFVGTERFFRPGYLMHLIAEWIPALTDIEAKLKAGGKVADIGCGHGASTILLAKAYPNSRFVGFDNHAPSIEHARRAALDAGVDDRVSFEVADATSFPGEGYDLIAFFDCFHDMGDPAGAARHAYETLADDGCVLLVEPMAGKTVEENFNPVGRICSAASTMCCTPNSLALGGPALGAVASDDALREMIEAGGFTRFRRAAETIFNRVFEVRR
jgi:SAM-dependent methyltransferase